MDFDINKCPPYNSSPSSNSNSCSSPSLVISSPCKPMTPPPNPNPSLSSQHHDYLMMSSSSSHKRKAGRKKFKETRHPIYRGVRSRNGDRWVCEVREPKKKTRIWLGTYPTPEMAARAHDVAVLALKGTSASFNFPDSPLVLPLVRSSSPTHLREAAAKAAKAFKPNISSSSSSSSLFSNLYSSGETIRHDNSQERRELGSCLKINMHCVEGDVGNDDNEGSKTMFLDEEALYNMPGLLDSMAEGLVITPPSMKRALDWDEIGCELTDLNLWGD